MPALYDLLIKSSKGDNDALLKVIEKFQPLLRKYAHNLNYEDAYSDLMCNLIETCKSFDMNNIRTPTQATLVVYIKTCVINSYKALLRNKLKEKSNLIYFISPSKDSECSNDNYIDFWDKLASVEDEHLKLEHDFLLSILTKYEAEVVMLFYFHKHSVKDIAQYYHVKPPAICQAKSSALRKLKKYYTEETHVMNGGV